MDEEILKRIEINPKIMGGKPVIKGTRVTVVAILKRLAEGFEIKEILEEYPYLKKEDIMATVAYAVKILGE